MDAYYTFMRMMYAFVVTIDIYPLIIIKNCCTMSSFLLDHHERSQQRDGCLEKAIGFYQLVD